MHFLGSYLTQIHEPFASMIKPSNTVNLSTTFFRRWKIPPLSLRRGEISSYLNWYRMSSQFELGTGFHHEMVMEESRTTFFIYGCWMNKIFMFTLNPFTHLQLFHF